MTVQEGIGRVRKAERIARNQGYDSPICSDEINQPWTVTKSLCPLVLMQSVRSSHLLETVTA